jgi:hypothetical protein
MKTPHKKKIHKSQKKRSNRRLIAIVAVSNVLLLTAVACFFVSAHKQPVSLDITKVSTGPSVSVFQADPGYKFVIFAVTITHHASSPRWITPVTDSYVTDETGTRYGMSPYALAQPFNATVYAPGEKATGELSYQVPQAAQKLQLCIRLDNKTSCQSANLGGIGKAE